MKTLKLTVGVCGQKVENSVYGYDNIHKFNKREIVRTERHTNRKD